MVLALTPSISAAIPRGAWQLVVDQGSFGHHNAATEISAAAFLGETRLYPFEWSDTDQVRANESLLTALKAFFKDNPGWD